MSWDFLSKLGNYIPKALEGTGILATQAIGVAARDFQSTPRTSTASDQNNLCKLEKKTPYDLDMEKTRVQVLAQIPPVNNPKLSQENRENLAMGNYLYRHPYIERDGFSGNDLSRDIARLQQYDFQKAVKSEDCAYRYNHSKEGQAEMRRQTEIDNARLRAHAIKYPPKKTAEK